METSSCYTLQLVWRRVIFTTQKKLEHLEVRRLKAFEKSFGFMVSPSSCRLSSIVAGRRTSPIFSCEASLPSGFIGSPSSCTRNHLVLKEGPMRVLIKQFGCYFYSAYLVFETNSRVTSPTSRMNVSAVSLSRWTLVTSWKNSSISWTVIEQKSSPRRRSRW